MKRIIINAIINLLNEYIAFKRFKESTAIRNIKFVRAVKLGNPQLYKDIMEELE